MENLLLNFENPVALVAFCTVASGWIINAVDIPKRELLGIITARQLTTWVTGAVLVAVGYFAGFGFLVGVGVTEFIAWILTIGLVSNGLFKVTLIQKALALLRAVNKRNG